MSWFSQPERSVRRNRQPSSSSAHRLRRTGQFEMLESRHMMTVTYHGGALLSNVEIQPVLLGSDWNTSSALTSTGRSLDGFNKYIANSPYMDMLTNAGYNVGRGTETAAQTLNLSLNKSTGITDSQIHSYLQSAISSSQLSSPDANRLYVVYVAPGVMIKDGSATSATSFLGYHGAFAGRDASGRAADIRYAVIAYPGTPNPSSGSQGFSSDFNQLTAVTSHELAEAVTDPDANYKAIGWYDDQRNGEIGDLTSRTTTLNGYVVQDVVDKNDNVIAPNPNSTGGTTGGSTGGSTGGTTSLSAPQNVQITAIDTTSAQLSWNSVSGAAGYRIFQVNGASTSLLGSVSSTATSVKITGLTAGTSASFLVEAYSGRTVADSAVVTVQMPTPPATTLTAPTVTAKAISSTSAQLTWNSVAGAQGYAIYYWNGVSAVLLGNVDASTTSVNVTGLSGGTHQFLVEAYNGSAVADSAWVSVTVTGRSRWLPWWF